MGTNKFSGEVELWVPNGTSKASLDTRIAALQAQGNRVIVFHSGRGDLAELTGDLLRINKDLEF